jgi:hypothetical protein
MAVLSGLSDPQTAGFPGYELEHLKNKHKTANSLSTFVRRKDWAVYF